MEILSTSRKIPQNITRSNLTCIYCGQLFSRSDHLKKHVEDRCKIKKVNDQEKEEHKNDMMKKQLDDLEKRLRDEFTKEMAKFRKDRSVIETNNISNVTINAVNGTINNIQVIAFGRQDDLDKYLLEEEIKLILSKGGLAST
jgi:hypothetical protein